MISYAPTDVAKILSFGKIGLGLTTINFLKLKFFMALAHAPMFSESCGLCNIKVMFLNDISNLSHDLYYNSKYLKVLNP